jgi:hypothetical protein
MLPALFELGMGKASNIKDENNIDADIDLLDNVNDEA